MLALISVCSTLISETASPRPYFSLCSTVSRPFNNLISGSPTLISVSPHHCPNLSSLSQSFLTFISASHLNHSYPSSLFTPSYPSLFTYRLNLISPASQLCLNLYSTYLSVFSLISDPPQPFCQPLFNLTSASSNLFPASF